MRLQRFRQQAGPVRIRRRAEQDHGVPVLGCQGAGAEHLTAPESAQQEPQQRDADDRPGKADPDRDQELPHLIGQPDHHAAGMPVQLPKIQPKPVIPRSTEGLRRPRLPSLRESCPGITRAG
jgi:hypothetical protein